MADTLEKRVADLEYLLAHIPEDLDARFAGVDVKLAELRELILLQSSRFTKLDARLNAADGKLEKLDARLTEVAQKLDAHTKATDGRFEKLDARLNELDGKLDAILARLPKP